MKTTTINVQISKCPRQYESVRIGLEATVDVGETAESAIKAANDFLLQMYADMYMQTRTQAQAQAQAQTQTQTQPQTQETPQKEVLHITDKRVQQIVKRIEQKPEKAAEIMENVHKYYTPDAEVERVLKTAAELI